MSAGPDEPFAAAVAGGTLAGGVWNGDADGVSLLAVHGITANHVAWQLAASALPGTRVIAPDLRGRGRSSGLPGLFTLNQHADDLARVLDHFALDDAAVAGHSMGAFVAVRFAERHPDRVRSLVLVDGGLPIPFPEGIAPQDLPAVVLGPALERLRMRFETPQQYEEFWKKHPAIGSWWNQSFADYVGYDLVGDEPELRSSVDPDAVSVNALELDGSDGYADALAALTVPIDFVRAPRGLLDGPPLYDPAVVADWHERMPGMRIHEAHDVNHYTILMTESGLRQLVPLLDPRHGTDAKERDA